MYMEIIWRSMSDNLPLDMCADWTSSNYPAHPSVWSVFIVCMKKFCILDYQNCAQWDSNQTARMCRIHAVLNLHWVHIERYIFWHWGSYDKYYMQWITDIGVVRKTRLYKYIDNFTSKNSEFSVKKLWYFSYFCSKHRLWVLVRTASGVPTSTHNLCFWAEIRKIMYTRVNHRFTI